MFSVPGARYRYYAGPVRYRTDNRLIARAIYLLVDVEPRETCLLASWPGVLDTAGFKPYMVNALLSATWASWIDELRHRPGGLAKSSRRSICALKPPHPSNMLNHERRVKETASQTLQCQIPANINRVEPKLPICSCWLGQPRRASMERMAIR
jgi:hypothetical protein